MDDSLENRLINSALILFEKYGFKNTTVNAIVEHSGSSKGGFYHHFKSKEAMLFVIHAAFINHVNQIIEESYNKKFESSKEQLNFVLNAFIHVYDKYKAHITVFNDENKYVSGEYKAEIVKSRGQFKNAMTEIIKDGQSKGEFVTDISPVVMTMSILGMVNWMYTWYKTDGPMSLDDISEQMTRYVNNAICNHQMD